MEGVPIGRVPVLKTVKAVMSRRAGSIPVPSSDTEVEVLVQYGDVWQYEPVDVAPRYAGGFIHSGCQRERLRSGYVVPLQEVSPVAISGSANNVFLLFAPGRRNPIPALLLNTNPDGTVNLLSTNGSGSVDFSFSVPVGQTYGGNLQDYRGNDNASAPLALRATNIS